MKRKHYLDETYLLRYHAYRLAVRRARVRFEMLTKGGV